MKGTSNQLSAITIRQVSLWLFGVDINSVLLHCPFFNKLQYIEPHSTPSHFGSSSHWSMHSEQFEIDIKLLLMPGYSVALFERHSLLKQSYALVALVEAPLNAFVVKSRTIFSDSSTNS